MLWNIKKIIRFGFVFIALFFMYIVKYIAHRVQKEIAKNWQPSHSNFFMDPRPPYLK